MHSTHLTPSITVTSLLAAILSATAAVALSSSAMADQSMHQWTDSTGKHKVEAAFIKLQGDAVVLRKKDGNEVTVPLARLNSSSKRLALSLADEKEDTGRAALNGSSKRFAQDPEIEFKVLLIIKRKSDSYSPLFLPIRADMTKGEVERARRCFEVETPAMVKEITKGRVKFTPTVHVSEEPLRVWDPTRLDSAEYYAPELINELRTLAKPGEYDSVGYYFLHYDTASGYMIPRAGYGVGGYDAKHGLGMFAVNCAFEMDTRDEIFLHEWMHGLDGFYGAKAEVKLPKGMLHGAEDHNYPSRFWRPKDKSRGYMHWYRDYLNGNINENGQMVGLGSTAWQHNAIREDARKRISQYEQSELPIKPYPEWIYDLMRGDLGNAELGPSLLEDPASLDRWKPEMWNPNAGTTAERLKDEQGTFVIENPTPNDAGLVQTVRLRPFSNYVFTAEVSTEGIEITEKGGRHSAILSANGSVSAKDMSGSNPWTPIVLPFTTGPNAEKTTLKLAVGGFCSVAKGRAYFRNVQVRQIGSSRNLMGTVGWCHAEFSAVEKDSNA